ncbi:hypothetical protein HOC86_00150 [archaeon]|jgi:hypothetical protein|nr:hypothetical protein [archaeon]
MTPDLLKAIQLFKKLESKKLNLSQSQKDILISKISETKKQLNINY